MYDRQGVLQSTSEPVAGLEHTLAWRPSGNLIAGTQRFGFEGGGAGKKERHDVVFFERNGLRHGEHGLRESKRNATNAGGNPIKWDYKVRELFWSSDSNVMAVWISREESDVGKLVLSMHGRCSTELITYSTTMDNGQLSLLPEARNFASTIVLCGSCSIRIGQLAS